MLITLKFSATVRKALSSGLIRSSSISLHGSVAGSVLQEVKMNRKKLSGRKLFLLIWLGVIVLLLVGIAVLSKLNPTEHTESVKEAMRDGVLHEVNKINFGNRSQPRRTVGIYRDRHHSACGSADKDICNSEI